MDRGFKSALFRAETMDISKSYHLVTLPPPPSMVKDIYIRLQNLSKIPTQGERVDGIGAKYVLHEILGLRV